MRRGTENEALYAPTLKFDQERGCHVGRLTLRVRYAESDQMGIVYNAHYLTWFEIGRTEWMRSSGISYRAVEERGFNLPLVEATFRLRASIRYDDLITVETWIARLRSRMIVFSYRIVSGTTVVAEGSTDHVCVRASDRRSVAFPGWLRGSIESPTG